MKVTTSKQIRDYHERAPWGGCWVLRGGSIFFFFPPPPRPLPPLPLASFVPHRGSPPWPLPPLPLASFVLHRGLPSVAPLLSPGRTALLQPSAVFSTASRLLLRPSASASLKTEKWVNCSRHP